MKLFLNYNSGMNENSGWRATPAVSEASPHEPGKISPYGRKPYKNHPEWPQCERKISLFPDTFWDHPEWNCREYFWKINLLRPACVLELANTSTGTPDRGVLIMRNFWKRARSDPARKRPSGPVPKRVRYRISCDFASNPKFPGIATNSALKWSKTGSGCPLMSVKPL